MTNAIQPTHRIQGPHPAAPAIVTLLLTVASVAVGAALSSGATTGSPFVPLADLTSRYRLHPFAVEASGFLQFAAAVPLGILAAVFLTRLRTLGVRVPGPSIGAFGGFLASVMLAVSALVSWTAAQPDVARSGALVRAAAVLSFVTGGTGYAVGIGLLIAGIAVPALFLRLLPRWLAVTGLVLAGLAELSSLSLLIDPLQYLIPVARFIGGLWLVVAALLLARTAVRS